MESLLQRGCPLEVRDRAGNLPWHFAVHGKAVDLVTFLLDRGCPLDAANDGGQNALHFAAETGAKQRHPSERQWRAQRHVIRCVKSAAWYMVDLSSTHPPTSLKQTSCGAAMIVSNSCRA